MPAKRPALRSADAAPPAAWADLFALGHDYFGELDPYGIDPRDRAGVEAAWAAFGPAYMAQWPVLRDTFAPGLPEALPWALAALGDPR